MFFEPHPPALCAKLAPPWRPARQLLRLALCDRVCAPAAPKAIVIHAPAGFGKTTLMLQCRDRFVERGIATTWLTLAHADNDLSRFAVGFAGAVATLCSGVDPATSAHDAAAALAALRSPFVLFLDEFECLHAQAVLALLRRLIDDLPRRGQIVIGSRSLPALGLGRLRVRGEMVEIDAVDLRFSLSETREFLRLRHVGAIDADSLAQLHGKTEGWVAALSLAALALDRHPDAAAFVRRFSGSDRTITEYLADNVLAGQTADVREFLLRTSILRELNVATCKALMPHADTQRILDHLASANLFLMPIHGDAPAYRYHSLFADFLRVQLAREHPEATLRLHLAASAWYEAQGLPVRAIDHAIEGGDFPLALSLMQPHAERFLEQGRVRLLQRWFAALPDAAVREHELLAVISFWAACLTNGPRDALRRLQASSIAESDAPDVKAHVSALRPTLLAMQEKYVEAHAAGRAGLARLPTGMPFADSMLCNVMAHVAVVMGEPRDAQPLLESARRAHGGGVFTRMFIESVEGLLDLQQGRMRQATARFRMALGSTDGASCAPTGRTAWAGVLYAGAMYESNQLEQADHLLVACLPLARDMGLPDHMIMVHVMHSRIAFLRGDIDTALHTLIELEYLGHHRELPRVVASAKLERAGLLMKQGNASASRAELDRADVAADWPLLGAQRLYANEVDDVAIVRARWELRFGSADQALQRLQAELLHAETNGRLRRALTLRVLRAIALQRSCDLPSALDEIGAVLQTCCAEGYVRLILDEGEPVATLIRRFAALRFGQASHRADPILADYTGGLLVAFGPSTLVEEDARAPSRAALPTEPLTGKEMRVLQLLAEGYSNAALAEKLFVSDSTVRSHLRNIHLKLGAKSRTQAVALARTLAIIR